MAEHQHHDQHGHEHHHDEHADHHGHGHQDSHGFSVDSLVNNDRLYEGVYREIVAWLGLGPGAVVLDAGSGAGGMTRILAEAVSPGGAVTALDASQEMLDATKHAIEANAPAARVEYELGDIAGGTRGSNRFDLVWSSRTIHHLPDQLAGVKALAASLKPGGRLALREGTLTGHFLPTNIGLGAPGLEDRIAVAHDSWFHDHVREVEGSVDYPYGWTKMLSDAGLSDVTAKTFLLEATAPFSEAQVGYMGRHLRRWVEDGPRRHYLADEDVALLEQLVDPASDHFVFGRPDLHLIETVTVYLGTSA